MQYTHTGTRTRTRTTAHHREPLRSIPHRPRATAHHTHTRTRTRTRARTRTRTRTTRVDQIFVRVVISSSSLGMDLFVYM